MELTELDSVIVFEDEYLVAINKPAGWVVNRSDTYKENTVQDWMEQRVHSEGKKEATVVREEKDFPFGTPEEIYKDRGGIVHRLDKDTSGILLLAKTPDVLMNLLEQFRERTIAKTYVALVHGKMAPSEGVIRLPMARSESDRKKFEIAADGRVSETTYTVIEHFPGLPKGIYEKKGKPYQGFSLLELQPKTGRTHQIRVHLSALKHPVVGDHAYAGKKRIVIDEEWCPRQFLHAKEIQFVHPVTNKKVHMEAPLPEDLQGALEKLTA